MIGSARAGYLSFGLACVAAVTSAYGQAPAALPAAPSDPHGAAYYAFAMGHLYSEMAVAYGNRAEYANKAIDFYRQAIKLDPGASYIGEELANFYIQTGQWERAQQEADNLLKAHPESAGAHKIQARIYSRQLDPDQGKIDPAMLKSSIAEYKKITELDPKDVESLANLGRLNRLNKDDAGAEAAYRAILAIDPSDTDALVNLAIVYADRGDMAGAIAMLKDAADKDPDVRTVTTLAELYENDKQFSKAADAWKVALPLTNNDIRVRRRYVQTLLQAKRGAEAVSAIESLANDDPKNLDLQLQLMGIYLQQHDFAHAEESLKKAQGISSGTPIKLAEADLLNQEGKGPQAIAVLESVLKDTKKTQYSNEEKDQRIAILEMTGELQRKADRIQDASASFRQIAELNPQVASKVEIEVIATLAQGHDYKAARAAADAAVKKYPNDRLILLEHASLLSEMGEFDAAVAELKAMTDAANDRELQVQIAEIQHKGKRFVDERKTLDRAEVLSSTEQEKEAIAMMRASLYEGEKNYDALEQQIRGILKTSPNNATALNYLGYVFADRNVRLEEAQQMIVKALEIEPGNGPFLDSLGWVHFRLNRLDQAADELRQALDKIGKDPTVHDHLGEVYFKQGKLKEAVQQWEASVAEMKAAPPSEQDPEELSKITRKLDSAKVRVAEKK
ncbi:MAG: tetratricopeptide repeat protein [Terriglobia bacterium]